MVGGVVNGVEFLVAGIFRADQVLLVVNEAGCFRL